MLSAARSAPHPDPAAGQDGGGREPRGLSLLAHPAALWSGCLLLLAALWGGLGWTAWREADLAAARRMGTAASDARGFSEYVALHLQILDRAIHAARERYLREGTLPGERELAGELGPIAPMVLQLAVADAGGHVVASTLGDSHGVSIADRPHFQAFAREPSERLYVGPPVVGRVSGRMSLQLARPVFSDGGRWAGVIVASVDPVRLQAYFRALDAFQDDGVVTLVGLGDGVIRVRFAAGEITWGQSLLRSAGWDPLSRQEAGGYRARSMIDGTDRIYGFQRVGSHALAVVVSQPAPRPGMPGDARSLAVAGMAAALSVLLVMLTAMQVRRTRWQLRTIERLRESQAREAQANRMKSSFLASVSHELRTPLHAILGFSDLIRGAPGDPNTAAYAGLIHDSGAHLHNLLGTLLDLARIEAGRMEVHVQEVDLQQLLAALAGTHRVSAEAKGLSLTLTMPAAARVLLLTDRTRLTQVINNVLGNAVKFTARGGIWVTGTPEAGGFVVRVVDTGVGIAPQRLARVFERFGDSSDGTGEERGSGLGLALSRELMVLLGGSISVQSQPGAGTQVDILVPGEVILES